jgi:hypothetical protein
MTEVARVLKVGAGITLITPLGFDRQCQDITHEWPPIVPASYLYYDPRWLEKQRLSHYAGLYGYRCSLEVADMLIEMAPGFEGHHHASHTLNSAIDLITILRRFA